MKLEDQNLMYPPLDRLLERIPQKYELVLTATRRAKQIIREQRLNPAGVSEEDRQIKPLTLALLDIYEERVGSDALLEPDVTFEDGESEEVELFPEEPGFGERPAGAEAAAEEPGEETTPPAEATAEDEEDDFDEDLGDIDSMDFGIEED
jgi:DNA-directed RNA polymerase omega subunit